MLATVSLRCVWATAKSRAPRIASRRARTSRGGVEPHKRIYYVCRDVCVCGGVHAFTFACGCACGVHAHSFPQFPAISPTVKTVHPACMPPQCCTAIRNERWAPCVGQALRALSPFQCAITGPGARICGALAATLLRSPNVYAAFCTGITRE